MTEHDPTPCSSSEPHSPHPWQDEWDGYVGTVWCPGVAALELVPIDLATAKRFIREHHRHNPKMTGWRVGVGLSNGELRGVAVLSRPVAIQVQQREPRTAEIIRVCTVGDKNANSRLYGAICRAAAALGYTAAITYTRPEESGASLRAAGFTQDEGEYGSKAGQQWHSRVQPLFDDGTPDTSGPKIRWRREFVA